MALLDDRVERDANTPPRRYNITIPPPEPITPEELARRRALYDESIALREAIGPIGISTDELIRQVRCEDDDYDY